MKWLWRRKNIAFSGKKLHLILSAFYFKGTQSLGTEAATIGVL